MSQLKEVLHNFDFGKKRFAFKFFLQPTLYQYFAQQPKTYRTNVSDWQSDYWNMFINNDADKVWMDDILAKLSKISNDTEEKVLIATNYVQSGLEYDWERYKNANGMQYPYETVFRGMGLCGDKAMLLTKILSKLGFQVAMLLYNKANHMALAIKVPKGNGNYINNNDSYAFIESTSQCQIGHIPERFVGGITLSEIPKFVFPKINGNRTFYKITELKKQEAEWTSKYGKDYLSASAYEKILLEEMYLLKQEINKLDEVLKKERSVISQVLDAFLPLDLFDNKEKLYKEYNSLTTKYNNRINAYRQSIDQRLHNRKA